MKLITLFIAIGLTAHCFALEDSPENRSAQAVRYLTAVPPAELISDLSANMVKNMPKEQASKFSEIMTKKLDIKAFSEAMKKSLIKVFTANELKALADFYSTPEGKSSMKKMGVYMADLMPEIQTLMQKAMQGLDEPASEK